MACLSKGVAGHTMTLSVDAQLIGESRSFSINFTQGTIDITNRDTNWWAEFLVGRREWTISFDGLWICSDLGKAQLLGHYTGRTGPLDIILVMPTEALDPAGAACAQTFTGKAILTDMTYDGPYEDAVTISGTLQGTCDITPLVS